MKVYMEVSSRYDFNFWSGARDTVKYLFDDEVETIFSMLDDMEPDGMDETAVNDFFWFEDDTIAEWLGWPDFETIMDARSRPDGMSIDTYEDYLNILEDEEEEEETEED